MITNETFEKFISSQNSLIHDLKDKHGAKLVYDEANDKENNKYWNNLKKSFDEGDKWLCSKLNPSSTGLDRHKYASLLLVVLIKYPLFESDKNNTTVGYSTASFTFAWKAALALLGSYIKKDKNKLYAEYVNSNGVFIPSENYMPEAFRAFYICFRRFVNAKGRKEDPPFPSMLDDMASCGKEAWGFVLLFANIFSLIETHSKACYELHILRKSMRKQSE